MCKGNLGSSSGSDSFWHWEHRKLIPLWGPQEGVGQPLSSLAGQHFGHLNTCYWIRDWIWVLPGKALKNISWGRKEGVRVLASKSLTVHRRCLAKIYWTEWMNQWLGWEKWETTQHTEYWTDLREELQVLRRLGDSDSEMDEETTGIG